VGLTIQILRLAAGKGTHNGLLTGLMLLGKVRHRAGGAIVRQCLLDELLRQLQQGSLIQPRRLHVIQQLLMHGHHIAQEHAVVILQRQILVQGPNVGAVGNGQFLLQLRRQGNGVGCGPDGPPGGWVVGFSTTVL